MTAERTRGSRKFGGGHTTITCDFRQPNGDGCPDSTPRKGDTAAGVREVTRDMGWSRVGGKDYCPVHTVEADSRSDFEREMRHRGVSQYALQQIEARALRDAVREERLDSWSKSALIRRAERIEVEW